MFNSYDKSTHYLVGGFNPSEKYELVNWDDVLKETTYPRFHQASQWQSARTAFFCKLGFAQGHHGPSPAAMHPMQTLFCLWQSVENYRIMFLSS